MTADNPPEQVTFVIIGSGFSGLGAAIRLQQRLAGTFSRLGDSARTKLPSTESIAGRRGFRICSNLAAGCDSRMARTC